MRPLDELADELLPDELKSHNLKVETKWHISTTLRTEGNVTNSSQYYQRFWQPADFPDEANMHKKDRFVD